MSEPPPTDPDGQPLGLLKICELLHMDNTGSGELEYGPHTRQQLLAYLVDRVANWKASPTPTRAYDDAVRALCLTVLAEKHWSNQ